LKVRFPNFPRRILHSTSQKLLSYFDDNPPIYALQKLQEIDLSANDSSIRPDETTYLSLGVFFYPVHISVKRVNTIALISVGTIAVALLYYYQILGYASIPVIKLSSYFLYEEVFLLALVPIAIPAFRFLKRHDSGDYSEPSPRKFLRKSFGILWIFDGILQMQLPFLTLFVQYNLIPLLGSVPIVTFLPHTLLIYGT